MLVRILLISLYMSSIAYAQVEVKFNAATALLLIPNAGIELQLGERNSIQLDVLGSFWDKMPLLNDTPLHINQTFLEYRWYKGDDLDKWFFGPHIGFGMFTLQKPNYLIVYDYYEEAAEALCGPRSFSHGHDASCGCLYRKNNCRNKSYSLSWRHLSIAL